MASLDPLSFWQKILSLIRREEDRDKERKTEGRKGGKKRGSKEGISGRRKVVVYSMSSVKF